MPIGDLIDLINVTIQVAFFISQENKKTLFISIFRPMLSINFCIKKREVILFQFVNTSLQYHYWYKGSWNRSNFLFLHINISALKTEPLPQAAIQST